MPSSLNPQAVKLNETIKKDNPVIFNLLSQKGRAIYFPKDGILGQTAEAKGTKINATIGIALEDDGSPVRLSSIADKILIPPKDVFPYAPSFGKADLRDMWFTALRHKNPSLKGKISTPIVTSALTHALSVVGYLFINPGDKIITPDKIWGNYRLIFENAYGGILDTYNTFKGNYFDVDAFEEKLKKSDRDKSVILFNFPNNPTGYTITQKEAKEIVSIIKKEAESGRRMVIICDDAYIGLVYKKEVLSESLFSFLANLHPNVLTIKVDGATKEQYVWGLRIGFIIYATRGITRDTCLSLEEKTAGVVRGSISNASNLSQSLIAEALSSSNYQKEKRQKYRLLKSRFEKVGEVLKDKKYKRYFSPLPFNSGYFMCLELKKGIDAEEVRKTLISKYATGVIAIKNLVRIAFSSVTEKDIPQVFENIYSACQDKIKN